MRIAVIGSGHIGGTLGRKFVAAGHDVVFGRRHPEEEQSGGDVQVLPVSDSLHGAQAVVLALPGAAVAELVHDNAQQLAGTVVIHATNDLGGSTANSHDAILGTVSDVRYVRAFNTLGWENLEDPRFGDEVADMFYSAPASAVDVTEQLIRAAGLRPVHVGDDMHDVVDGLLRLWFALSRTRGRRIAFRLLEQAR